MILVLPWIVARCRGVWFYTSWVFNPILGCARRYYETVSLPLKAAQCKGVLSL